MADIIKIQTFVRRYDSATPNKPVVSVDNEEVLTVESVGIINRSLIGSEVVTIDLSEVIPDSPDQRLGVVLVETDDLLNVVFFGSADTIPVNGGYLWWNREGAELAPTDKTIVLTNPGTVSVAVSILIANLIAPV